MTESDTPAKVATSAGLGPLPEPAAMTTRYEVVPPDHGSAMSPVGSLRACGMVAVGYTAEQVRAYAAQEVASERERCARLAVDAAAEAVKKYEADPDPVRQPYANNRLMHVGWAAAEAIRGA